MDIVEITTKSALVRSRIPGVAYVINPYLGCGHGCRYCYAVFMRKYSHGHQSSRWGTFVEAKTNIADVLRKELAAKRTAGTAMLSSVCDPYQPAEEKYKLTRRCIQALKEFGWGIDILTRSPLVLNDIDLLSSALDACVGLSIPTDDDRVRGILEPNSPPIASRIDALNRLHSAGIRTWAFIAPMLPMDPENLAKRMAPHVDFVKMDAMNYPGQIEALFRQQGWTRALSEEYAQETARRLRQAFGGKADDAMG